MRAPSVLKRVGVAAAAGMALATSGWIAPAQAASRTDCTTLWVRSDQSADVCKHYQAVGGGYYDGYVQVTRASQHVRVVASMDGATSTVTRAGGTGKRNFSSIRQAYLQACFGTGSACTGWW
ncbi:hypothetical protein Ait01nite_014580 [Actinoplanes italicus]|uniref:Uncharacterized protein n=1 Tax=Actinoplanes italicus TaxID=113567 RepID=A0A2T0KHI3_9ACTN|nr:hypothetical protein [Actinoplanes italicus]PRX22891.1 hypothetical protein CLV67_104419 [Actinoplanes italicus]GIE28413.1 hypothetical protein Ait01nite_014580 [Actinoplanes italicus]